MDKFDVKILVEWEPFVFFIVEFVGDVTLKIGLVVLILVLDIVDEEKIMPEIVILLDMVNKATSCRVKPNLCRPTDKTLVLKLIIHHLLDCPQFIKIVHNNRGNDRHEQKDNDIEIKIVPDHSCSVDHFLRVPLVVYVEVD